MTPETIDRYVLEGALGEGGMGRVYRAFDPRLGRRVALKVLLGSAEPVAVARMVREARAAAAFNHPNVVSIYDVGEVDGSPYIAMELVVGQSLRALIAEATVSQPQRLAWLVDVARGLGAAHRAGLVHRDIKPDNVMITTDGVVKILDFGIARHADGEDVDGAAPTVTPNLPSLTAEGSMIGTPQYMAPEQLRGERVDRRADEFAWGVLAFEVLSGALPWAATKSGPQLVAAVLSAPARSLRDVVPAIDPRVSEVVARALSKHRDERFATMEDLVAALTGTLSSARVVVPGEEGVSPKAQTVASVAVPRARGRTLVMFGAIGAVLAGSALVAVTRSTRASRVEPVAPRAVDAALVGPRVGRPPANAVAAGAYEAAIQANADGQSMAARRNLKQAVEADPSLAAAQLRLALLAFTQGDAEDAHAAYQAALQHRAALGEVDSAVLEALEPKVRVPPVASEYVTRIGKVAAAYPKDPWPSFLEGDALGEAGRLDEAAKAYDRALAADPKYVMALFGKASLMGFRGDYEAALVPLETCVRASPANLECVAARTRIFGDLGRCDEAIAEAKRGLAVEPTTVELYDALASASAAQGAPVETVGAFLARGIEATLPEYRARNGAVDAENVLELAGDLRGAEVASHAWEKVLVDAKQPTDEATTRRFTVASEMGELPAHRAEILAAWNRAPAWVEPGDRALMHLAHREYEVGLLTRKELDERRDAWRAARAEEDARNGAHTSAYTIWKVLYAIDASTDAEAREALAHVPDDGVIPATDKADPEDQLAVGLVRARAGDYAGAIPLLTYATRACSIVVRDWIEQTRGFYYLGVSLERAGDVEGARRAYETVVSRLGHAKPRSLTSDLARKRLAALNHPR